jgi:TRAP-type mannitol/chloroaromatic compound transport system permease small subunit
MQKYISFADGLSDWTGRYTSYLIIPMIGVIVYTALLRFIFDIAVEWGFEVSMFVYGVHCFLGGGYAMLLKAHITVDTIPSRLSDRAQKYIRIFSFLIVIAVCLVAVWLGSIWAWKSTMIWERSIHQTVFNPPVWWFKWVIPVSAALIVVQALADMMKVMQDLSAQKKGN